MNMPDPQAMASAWMSQMTDPSAWQAMFTAVPQGTSPVAKLLKDAGATIPPQALESLRNDYLQKAAGLWQEFLAGKTPALADRRFAAPEWLSNPMSAYSAASYLLNAEFLTAMADAVESAPRERQKIRFAVQQMVDAMSPANFLATNPEAQQKLIETKGESLTRGLANMLGDMQKGRISLSDESAFEVGRNVATTPGQVVFENELFQLIQYTPATPTVRQVPLLMMPPCINKFYILDLQPENSVVRYAVEQGNTVFLVSWRNPDAAMGATTWDDYVETGAIKAIEVTRAISGSDQVNAFGFCVGGTIMSTALAVLAARGEQPAASLTLLTTLLDFEETGVLEVFIDETQVALREQALAKGGLMPGRDLATTFSSLRPNDLVWNYVQSNYLKGKEPPPFDLLYWNSDSTNLPGPMFCWYLRNTYLENSLKVPGKLTVAGAKVDLGAIEAPVFVYGSREDHIVPWSAAYGSMHILNPGNAQANRFVMGASGHIAGVINPASKNKRSYWTNDAAPAAPAGKGKSKAKAEAEAKASVTPAQEWLDGATEHKGSWWPEWAAFLADHGGKQVKAPAKAGSKAYQPIEPAPGRYVKVRAD
ncbi:class I poly(R)-hydroxyalkanoic acid synthase [Massilia sp. DJPM01]|uniref:class I poly(R)-hydroxyalkanoic acid synthase n=1 Tax=Massilia sp. DJPM01 TaxID=3024404 RepID=UPI00259E846F|nr:class I poly(R)-hydroxyalkanoic acid synthase [Massilia sp. DJPM01]MDM5180928.1 class I poly(R)-hydroxyalkanoic acid synthase [Massilia sp. DJPM01]